MIDSVGSGKCSTDLFQCALEVEVEVEVEADAVVHTISSNPINRSSTVVVILAVASGLITKVGGDVDEGNCVLGVEGATVIDVVVIVVVVGVVVVVSFGLKIKVSFGSS